MNKILAILLISSFSGIFSQENNTNIFTELNKPAEGSAKIFQDPKIKVEFDKHLETFAKKQGVVGYRIQIFFGSDKSAREAANKERAKFISKFTYVKAYLQYFNPYWKVRVGDFRNISEANLFMEKIKGKYPDAFIVKDIIKVEKSQ